MTAAAMRRSIHQPKAGRQPRTKTTVGDVECASKTEGRFLSHLLQLQRAGIVVAIEPHPSFPIQAKFTNARGVKRRARKYTADFEVVLPDGTHRIFEVKGAQRKKGVIVGPFTTPEFKIRRDAAELAHGIAIWTVYPDGGQWIDADTKAAVVWS